MLFVSKSQKPEGVTCQLADCSVYCFRNEGLRGFYKGLLPSLLRVTPATAITFLVYENVSHALRSRRTF